MEIPRRLAWVRGSAEGRAWLDALPGRVRACAERWELDLGRPFAGSQISLVLPATRADGTPAVLKLQLPHRECEHEAAALVCWGGEGAVRLLDHDPERHALLLERCRPGSSLLEREPAAALAVLEELVRRLSRPAGAPFDTVAREAARWAEHLPRSWERAGRPFERALLEAALEAIEALREPPREPVLVHQDLHPGNVLRAEREPWLAIDPKPLLADRAFALAPILRADALGHDEASLRARLDRLPERLGVDRERARRAGLAQTLAWAFQEGVALPRHVEVARWLHRAA